MSSLYRRLGAVLLAAGALAGVPAVAGAADGMDSIIEDDSLLFDSGAAQQARALDDFVELGADTVRALVLWHKVAPDPGNKRRPRNFDAANPAAYPPGLWDRYDDFVRGAQARGLRVILNPSGPIPAWASECKGSADARRACRPRSREFGKFVQAMGARYSGAYFDENQNRGVLPRVDRWSIWNEPNQPGWLNPQYVLRSKRRVAFAAHRYRALAKSAIAGLRRAGHDAASDQILLGETAPIGGATGPLARRRMPPVEFVRELFCLDRRGRQQRGRAARLAGCRRPGRLAVSGFAHHPYTRGGSQPPRARVLPGEITISSASRLKRLLAQGARAGRIPRNLPIHYTEFGFQTNPPDRLFGVSLAEQARYINEGDWIAFRDPRIRSTAQYKLIDEPELSSFQTGLRFLDGTAKPAYDAYRLPIWVVRRGTSVLVYGQVRPAADGAAETVEIQHSTGGGFQTVQTVGVTSPRGHFTATVPRSGGQWRLRWLRRGRILFSRTAEPSSR